MTQEEIVAIEEVEEKETEEQESTISYVLLTNMETWYVVTVYGHRFHQPDIPEDLKPFAIAGEAHVPDQEARDVPEHPLDADQQYEALLNITCRIGFSPDYQSMRYATHLLHCLNRQAKVLRDSEGEAEEAIAEIYEAKNNFLASALRAGLATVESYEFLRSQYYHYQCDCGKEWNSSDEVDPDEAVCFRCSRSPSYYDDDIDDEDDENFDDHDDFGWEEY